MEAPPNLFTYYYEYHPTSAGLCVDDCCSEESSRCSSDESDSDEWSSVDSFKDLQQYILDPTPTSFFLEIDHHNAPYPFTTAAHKGESTGVDVGGWKWSSHTSHSFHQHPSLLVT